jgi:uncharacterized membrane protein (DUF2068 family)
VRDSAKQATDMKTEEIVHKDYTSPWGIHAIAIFEMVKGLLGLIAGIAMVLLMHRDFEALAVNILEYLHVDPAGSMAQSFVENAAKIDESNVALFAGLAFVYTIVRFVEAYGLWRLRAWAEWFAIISGSIYIPVEIYEIFRKPTIVRVIILLGNFVIVGYLIYVRREANYHRAHPAEPYVEVFTK